jgi:hypothetical protein
MRPLLARLFLLAWIFAALTGCSNDATSPDNRSSNQSSIRDNTGDSNQPPLHGGTIAGKIFNDVDGDGDMGAGESGVSDLLVTLKRASSGGGATLGTQRVTRTSADGGYRFAGLAAGTYQLTVSPSSRIASTPNPLDVVLTETNGVVSDVLDANLGVLAEDDEDGDQNGDDDGLVVGVFIRVTGDYFPDSNVFLASGWVVDDCSGEACALGRLRGPITFIDDRSRSFAVMGTLMRSGEAAFPLYAQVGQRAEVLLHHVRAGDDFIADLVRPWLFLQDEIQGRIDQVTVSGHSARLVVLDTVVIIHGIDNDSDDGR